MKEKNFINKQNEIFKSTAELYEVDEDDEQINSLEVDDFLKDLKKTMELKEKQKLEKSKQQSAVKPKQTSQLVLPMVKKIDPETTIKVIEENEMKKIKSNLHSPIKSSLNNPPQVLSNTDFSQINLVLNLVKKRITFHLELAKEIKKTIKSVFGQAFVYTLIFHARNLVNKAMQILSGELPGDGVLSNNWDDYMATHDHSIQTDNFVHLSDKTYKILYNNYEKLEHLKRAKPSEAQLYEVGKLIYDPDDETTQDITEPLDLLLVGLQNTLQKRLGATNPKNRLPAHTVYILQAKVALCRLMNAIGVFADVEVYDAFKIDDLLEKVDQMQDDQVLLTTIMQLNSYMAEYDK